MTGGGLIRSAGLILGSGEFVEEIPGDVDDDRKSMMPARLRFAEARDLIERQCIEKGLSVEALQYGSRSNEYKALRQESVRKLVFEVRRQPDDSPLY